MIMAITTIFLRCKISPRPLTNVSGSQLSWFRRGRARFCCISDNIRYCRVGGKIGGLNKGGSLRVDEGSGRGADGGGYGSLG